MFPLDQIALTAAAAFVASVGVLWIMRRRDMKEMIVLALVVGISVLAWRLAGNVAQLNDDPIPLFSPNDFLSPVVTYVSLGMYAAFRRSMDLSRWERTRAWLTVVSFVVNVLFI